MDAIFSFALFQFLDPNFLLLNLLSSTFIRDSFFFKYLAFSTISPLLQTRNDFIPTSMPTVDLTATVFNGIFESVDFTSIEAKYLLAIFDMVIFFISPLNFLCWFITSYSYPK